jgi:uncharacterized membrane protein YfcA
MIIMELLVEDFKKKVKKQSRAKEKILMVVFGALVGAINGFFGGGGGMVVVPVLTFILKKPCKVSHATAILIILPVTLASSIVYLVKGYFSFFLFLPTGIGVVLGGVIGAILLGKFKSKIIGYIFSFIMFLAGINSAFF